MFDQLLQLVREQAGQTLAANPNIPSSHNDALIGETTVSIEQGIQNALANGDLKQVLGLFSGKQDVSSSPVVQQISGNLIDRLKQHFNMDGQSASSLTGSLIPTIMGALVNKSQDSNSGFSLDGLIGSLTGGQPGGANFSSLLSKFAGGLDQDGDGDVDLDDLSAFFSKGAQTNVNKKGSGELGDILGKLFGK
jgi:hypothetical protein